MKHVGWKEEVTPTSVNWHVTRLCNYSCKFCRTIDRVTDSVNSVFASRGEHLLSALSVTSFQSCAYLASVYTCVFAYGQSGTGKSITIVSLMSTPSELSLLPRLLNDIFAAYDQMRSEGAEVNCKLEMIALYNEQIRDLLAQTQMEELRCMEAVEQACLAQETELETVGAQQSEELCRVTDDHGRVVSEVEYLHELLLQQELAAQTCESRSVQKFRAAEVDQERLQAELHECQASCFELSSLHLHVAQREEDLRTLEIQRDQFRVEVETLRCIEEEEGQHHELETSALDHLQRLEGQLHDAQSQLGMCQSQESVLQTMEARFDDEMLVLRLDRDAVRFDNE